MDKNFQRKKTYCLGSTTHHNPCQGVGIQNVISKREREKERERGREREREREIEREKERKIKD